MPSVYEHQKNKPENPTPNPEHVLEAIKQNIPTTETQPKNKEHLFFLDEPETSVICLVDIQKAYLVHFMFI